MELETQTTTSEATSAAGVLYDLSREENSEKGIRLLIEEPCTGTRHEYMATKKCDKVCLDGGEDARFTDEYHVEEFLWLMKDKVMLKL